MTDSVAGGRIIIYPDKLRGCWEREKIQRLAKRYDDDGNGKDLGLRLLLLAAVTYYGGEAPPPTNEQRSNGQDKTHGAKTIAALRRVRKLGGYGAPWCFQPINTYVAKLRVECTMQGL